MMRRGMMRDMMDEFRMHPMMMDMMFMMEDMVRHQAGRSRMDNGHEVQDYNSGMLVMQELYYQSVKRLVDNSQDVNAIRIDGEPVLSLAIEKGWNEMVNSLIEKGASLKGANSSHLLNNAISNGDTGIINKLLDYGLELNERNLLEAIKNNKPEIVDMILGRGVTAHRETEDYFLSSIKPSNFDTFKKLVNQGALDANAKNGYDSTFLQKLCMNTINEGEELAVVEAAKYLLSAGNDINYKNKEGKTALDYAFEYYGQRRGELILYLIENGAQMKDANQALSTLIHNSNGSEGDIKIFDMLLNNFKDINYEKLTKNLTPLLGKSGRDQFIQCAISNGINISSAHYLGLINQASRDFITNNDLPGLKARFDGFLKADSSLKDVITDSEGLLAVTKNFGKTKTPFVEFFLEQGLNPNKQDEKGNTPLLLIVKSGKLDENAITALLKHGADPDIENQGGDSPMNVSRAARALIKDIQESLAQDEESDMKM